jgi:hypothetical protein
MRLWVPTKATQKEKKKIKKNEEFRTTLHGSMLF